MGRGRRGDSAKLSSCKGYGYDFRHQFGGGGRHKSPAPAGRTPGLDLRVEVNVDDPPTEDADRFSATNSEVESAMNHRHRRAALRDPNFSEEAFNAFNSGDAYIQAAQDGLARATDQYVKDIRVRKANKYVY